MDKIILYTRHVGGLAVLIPAPQAQETLTDDQFAEWLTFKDVPTTYQVSDGNGGFTEVSYDPAPVVCDRSVLPTDATFRDAWSFNGVTISVDLEKARVIALVKVNAAAAAEYAIRSKNTGIGIANIPDDAAWLAGINAKRAAVAAASSVTDLLTAIA